jgi:hypothetical protein
MILENETKQIMPVIIFHTDFFGVICSGANGSTDPAVNCLENDDESAL